MVVVTGIGIVAPTGLGTEGLLRSLRKGESAATELSSSGKSVYPANHACRVQNFNPTDFLSFKNIRHMTRCSQLGVVAAKLAVQDSALDLSQVDSVRIEMYEGTSIGGMDKIFQNHRIFLEKDYTELDPHVPISAFVGSASGEIAIALGVRCRSITICSGSASANDAIGLGFERISSRSVDIAIVGASEAPIIPEIIASFCRTGVISTRNGNPKAACRPFSKDRDGFILGEGAAFLVLESREHAKARGAHIYAELAGYGSNCDAYHMVTPHPEGEGVCFAIKRALAAAGLVVGDIDYVNAHGTATLTNDKVETVAFKRAFGSFASQIPISSTKPITGHLLGASGAIEAVVCTLAINHSFLPPTINYSEPDPDCDLSYVPNKAQEKDVSVALSCNYGFGGKNSVLVFRKC